MALPLCLIMHKAKHTIEELRSLARAPYVDASRVCRKIDYEEHKQAKHRASPPSPPLDEISDDNFLPEGSLIHSHTIAPSTRLGFEKFAGIMLPSVSKKNSEPLMQPIDLCELLSNVSCVATDTSMRSLFELLGSCSKLGFRVAWCEGYDREWMETIAEELVLSA